MLELLILGLAVASIAKFASARGASPWVAGAIAVVGHFALRWLLVRIPIDQSPEFTALTWSWAWVGGVALVCRFLVGRARQQPDGPWKCQRCGLSNEGFALECKACGSQFGGTAPV